MGRRTEHPERRVAVVTGASSGIGAEAARGLAAAGFPVILGARRVERCEEIAAAIRDEGGDAVALALDVADTDSVRDFAAATQAHGTVEIVISNAGDVRPIPVTASPDEFSQQVAVNLLGAQLMAHHFAPPMIERRRGDFVFVTSEVAHSPRPRMAGYVAAKSGLEGLANAMRMECEGTGVRVGIVRPGPSLTEQGATWDPGDIDETLRLWRHWGLVRHDGYLRPRNVADAIVAMVSAPRGTHLAVIEVQPEAPIEGGPDE